MASSLPSGPTLGASSSRMEAPDTYISSVERHTQALWVYEGDQMVHHSVGRFASLALGRAPKVDTAEQEGTGARDDEGDGEFARGDHVKAWPSPEQFLKHPLALFALLPKDAALFLTGAVGGAAAKTLTTPVDRIKLLMQTHSARIIGKSARAGIGFFEATAFIVKEEGVKGFWKEARQQVSFRNFYFKLRGPTAFSKWKWYDASYLPTYSTFTDEHCPEYRDRAAERRALHGSCGIAPGEKNFSNDNIDNGDGCFESPFVEETAIRTANVPFGPQSYSRQLLEGMGWKEGEGIGRTKNGILQPLQVADKVW